MSSRRSVALVSLVLLMILWGSTFVVTKAAMRELPPLTLAAVRFLIAAAALAPAAVLRGGLKQLPRPLPIKALVLMSLTGVAFFNVGFNYALIHASASQGALIFALVPGAVTLAAVLFLREHLPRRRLAGILLSISGVLLVVAAGERGEAAPKPLLGAAWMAGAVVTWAAYTVYAKRLAHADQVVVVTCASVIGSAMLLPFAAIELAYVPWPSPSLEGWLGTVFLGVVASALAFVVYSRVLRELDASLVGAFANLEPVVGVLTAAVFLGETLRAWQIVGGLVALAGMWLASTGPAAQRSVAVDEQRHA